MRTRKAQIKALERAYEAAYPAIGYIGKAVCVDGEEDIEVKALHQALCDAVCDIRDRLDDLQAEYGKE